MSRLAWVLTALVAVLIGVLWWFLLWSPTSEEIENVRVETESVQSQAQQQRGRAAQLRQIRENAPESEAELALARTLIPVDVGIPSLLRQLQTAADDSDIRLTSISPSAPSSSEIEGVTVEVVGVSMSIEGTYFQIIDFVRRIEDPATTSRAMTWTSASLSPSDYPTLSVSLSGQIYSREATTAVADVPPDEAADEPTGGVDERQDVDENGELVS